MLIHGFKCVPSANLMSDYCGMISRIPCPFSVLRAAPGLAYSVRALPSESLPACPEDVQLKLIDQQHWSSLIASWGANLQPQLELQLQKIPEVKEPALVTIYPITPAAAAGAGAAPRAAAAAAAAAAAVPVPAPAPAPAPAAALNNRAAAVRAPANAAAPAPAKPALIQYPKCKQDLAATGPMESACSITCRVLQSPGAPSSYQRA